MKYNFDEYINRRGTGSLKWDAGDFLKMVGLTDRYDEETIPLFTADMDLPVGRRSFRQAGGPRRRKHDVVGCAGRVRDRLESGLPEIKKMKLAKISGP